MSLVSAGLLAEQRVHHYPESSGHHGEGLLDDGVAEQRSGGGVSARDPCWPGEELQASDCLITAAAAASTNFPCVASWGRRRGSGKMRRKGRSLVVCGPAKGS